MRSRLCDHDAKLQGPMHAEGDLIAICELEEHGLCVPFDAVYLGNAVALLQLASRVGLVPHRARARAVLDTEDDQLARFGLGFAKEQTEIASSLSRESDFEAAGLISWVGPGQACDGARCQEVLFRVLAHVTALRGAAENEESQHRR
eukprot:CAMPEP_0180502832 /NCGR_PEP_ID=MMETSP1036_2-20121128/45667_1 /TAXON_ID=632150 /ORGANISM="Azadinium spinosum, Strain 3D9" /LENGTH=146 /DNA_ID=CAMNT_0022511735 /DNA_START=308 /DNA_END=745 /DNA_ORIENTATION=+